VELSDRKALLNSVTSLNSKVVSVFKSAFSVSVNAVMDVTDPAIAASVNLRGTKIAKKVGGQLITVRWWNGRFS
jgi:hypothetical protein